VRIIDCRQQTEEWERWRNRPTASEFGKFCTPARGDYSSGAEDYAAKIVSKQLGTYTEPPPSFWMDWGTEMEPNAKYAYTLKTGRKIAEVGFILPDDTDAYGGSPDGLVLGDNGYVGGLEVKCPKAETLMVWRKRGVLPVEHRPQVQGLLLISGLPWWDFFVFHPELEPFLLRVEPDEQYQTKIAKNLLRLLKEIAAMASVEQKVQHRLVSPTASTVRFEND